jgi:hypothetical protein
VNTQIQYATAAHGRLGARECHRCEEEEEEEEGGSDERCEDSLLKQSTRVVEKYQHIIMILR